MSLYHYIVDTSYGMQNGTFEAPSLALAQAKARGLHDIPEGEVYVVEMPPAPAKKGIALTTEARKWIVAKILFAEEKTTMVLKKERRHPIINNYLQVQLGRTRADLEDLDDDGLLAALKWALDLFCGLGQEDEEDHTRRVQDLRGRGMGGKGESSLPVTMTILPATP